MSAWRRVLSLLRAWMARSSAALSPRRRLSVSVNMRMEVSGVRSSCETLETKSAWSSERLRSRRRNTHTRITPVTRVPVNDSTRMPEEQVVAALVQH